MMKWLIHRKLAAFENQFGYDASYMHEVLDIDFGAFMKFARAAAIGNYRKDVPADLYCAVGLVGVITADCGPCAQLGVTMALQQGVPGTTIATILRRWYVDRTRTRGRMTESGSAVPPLVMKQPARRAEPSRVARRAAPPHDDRGAAHNRARHRLATALS
jgi:hypothetical protein